MAIILTPTGAPLIDLLIPNRQLSVGASTSVESTISSILDTQFQPTPGTYLGRTSSGWSCTAPNGLYALTFQKSGAISVATDIVNWNMTPTAMTAKGWIMCVKTAPVGADLIINILRSTDLGSTFTTIWTNTGNRARIFDGNNINFSVAAQPDVFSYSAHDIFRLDVIQVGSGTAGSDLTVTLYGDAAPA